MKQTWLSILKICSTIIVVILHWWWCIAHVYNSYYANTCRRSLIWAKHNYNNKLDTLLLNVNIYTLFTKSHSTCLNPVLQWAGSRYLCHYFIYRSKRQWTGGVYYSVRECATCPDRGHLDCGHFPVLPSGTETQEEEKGMLWPLHTSTIYLLPIWIRIEIHVHSFIISPPLMQ